MVFFFFENVLRPFLHKRVCFDARLGDARVQRRVQKIFTGGTLLFILLVNQL